MVINKTEEISFKLYNLKIKDIFLWSQFLSNDDTVIIATYINIHLTSFQEISLVNLFGIISNGSKCFGVERLSKYISEYSKLNSHSFQVCEILSLAPVLFSYLIQWY